MCLDLSDEKLWNEERERERKVPTGNKRQNGELSAGLLQSGSRAGRPAFQREHLDVYVFRRGRALEITSTGSKN